MSLFPGWVGTTKEECACFQNECKRATGQRSAPIWTPEQRPGLCAPGWNKNQCFYTHYLFHYVFALCLTKAANANSIRVHIPNTMLLLCRPSGAPTAKPKHLGQTLVHKTLQKATLPVRLVLPSLSSASILAQLQWITDNNSHPSPCWWLLKAHPQLHT